MRVGFVGCGGHATNALYPALRPAGLELVATCARSVGSAQRAAAAFGAERAYDDLEKLLTDGGVDALLVSVPPEAYGDIVVTALEAGLPVFCEKPGGDSVATLTRIEAAAAAARRPVMVGYMKRFAAAYREARRRVGREGFGRVTSVHMKFVVGPGFGSLREFVIDNPVHAFDLLRAVAGEVADLSAAAWSLDDDRHALSVLLRFVDGAVGTAQLGTTASFFQENELLEIVGEQQSITVTNVDTLVWRPDRGPTEVVRPTYTVPLPANLTGTTMGFVPELAHFRDVVVDGLPCESDVGSARRTLELAQRVLDTVNAGEPRQGG